MGLKQGPNPDEQSKDTKTSKAQKAGNVQEEIQKLLLNTGRKRLERLHASFNGGVKETNTSQDESAHCLYFT